MANVGTGTQFAQLNQLLLEKVHLPLYDAILPEDDDPGWQFLNRADPIKTVGRRMDSGSGYEASYRVKVQSGGTVAGARFSNPTTAQMGYDSILNMSAAVGSTLSTDLFPDPMQAPETSYTTVRMYLKKGRGVYRCTREQMTARLASDPLEDVALDVSMDVARLVRAWIMNAFWGDGLGTVAQVDLAAGYTINGSTNAPMSVHIKNGAIKKFIVGQNYVFADDVSSYGTTAITWRTIGGNSTTTPTPARCVDINVKDGNVVFQLPAGSGGNITLADSDRIIWAEALVQGSADTPNNLTTMGQGVDSLLLDSGTFPGTSFDAGNHQWLRSKVLGSTASPVDPSPDLFAEDIDLITEEGYAPPEDIFAEQPVWTRYGQMERATGVLYPVPNGGQFTPSGGINAPVLGHFTPTGSVAFRRNTSRLCRKNSIYGLAADTWMKIMPAGEAAILWARSNSGVSGFNGIFREIAVGNNSRLTDVLSAEFEFLYEVGCNAPRRQFRHHGIRNVHD